MLNYRLVDDKTLHNHTTQCAISIEYVMAGEKLVILVSFVSLEFSKWVNVRVSMYRLHICVKIFVFDRNQWNFVLKSVAFTPKSVDSRPQWNFDLNAWNLATKMYFRLFYYRNLTSNNCNFFIPDG